MKSQFILSLFTLTVLLGLIALSGNDASVAADAANPTPIQPQTSTRTVGSSFDYTMPENSLTIIRFPTK